MMYVAGALALLVTMILALARALLADTVYDRILAVTGPGHPLADERHVTFEQIKPYGWIVPPLETTLRRQLDQFFVAQGQYSPPLSIESVSYLANRSLLRSRELIGLLPADVVRQDLRNGYLRELNWKVPFGHGPVGISYRDKDSMSPAGRAFMGALHRAVEHL